MREKKINKLDLIDALDDLGHSTESVADILKGTANLTLATISDLEQALGIKLIDIREHNESKSR